MRCPWVTPREKELLYSRFYRGDTDEGIADSEGCSREKISKDIQGALMKLKTFAFFKGMEGSEGASAEEDEG
jgi:DNA-binding CsgD family transcriptional regulator